MALCEYCGKETGLPNPDTCNNCHDLIRHLPTFVKSREGKHLVANALELQRAREMMAEHDAKVRAVAEGKTTAELEAMLAEKRHMMSQLVGNLYPGILQGELLLVQEAIELRKSGALKEP